MKYEILWDEAQQVDDATLYRIRALRDIPRHNVKAGDLGGYVEGEHNLDQNDDSWIRDGVCVFGPARIESAGETDKGEP
ncbi:hypothetical protein LAC50_002848 [Escherichia coli]|nr:hypothetical protein [Escherichia coli]